MCVQVATARGRSALLFSASLRLAQVSGRFPARPPAPVQLSLDDTQYLLETAQMAVPIPTGPVMLDTNHSRMPRALPCSPGRIPSPGPSSAVTRTDREVRHRGQDSVATLERFANPLRPALLPTTSSELRGGCGGAFWPYPFGRPPHRAVFAISIGRRTRQSQPSRHLTGEISWPRRMRATYRNYAAQRQRFHAGLRPRPEVRGRGPPERARRTSRGEM